MAKAKRVRILLFGATGRMGKRIAEAAASDARVEIAHRLSRANLRSLRESLKSSDVAIDFSSPGGSLKCAQAAAAAKVPLVVGTTGFTPAQFEKLKRQARKTAVLFAPNCSPGMNLLFELGRIAAAALADYDAAITETHHRKKVDAPSGSAKKLADAVRKGRGARAAVPTVSLRAGDVVGDHTLVLAGPDERLELTHRAQNRAVFARGALDAALWIRAKKKGFFAMNDLLRL